MILTRDGRAPYRLRFWYYGVRIFLRETWRWLNGRKPGGGLRWQFEATYRATYVHGRVDYDELVRLQRDEPWNARGYYEQAPQAHYWYEGKRASE